MWSEVFKYIGSFFTDTEPRNIHLDPKEYETAWLAKKTNEPRFFSLPWIRRADLEILLDTGYGFAGVPLSIRCDVDFSTNFLKKCCMMYGADRVHWIKVIFPLKLFESEIFVSEAISERAGSLFLWASPEIQSVDNIAAKALRECEDKPTFKKVLKKAVQIKPYRRKDASFIESIDVGGPSHRSGIEDPLALFLELDPQLRSNRTFLRWYSGVSCECDFLAFVEDPSLHEEIFWDLERNINRFEGHKLLSFAMESLRDSEAVVKTCLENDSPSNRSRIWGLVSERIRLKFRTWKEMMRQYKWRSRTFLAWMHSSLHRKWNSSSFRSGVSLCREDWEKCDECEGMGCWKFGRQRTSWKGNEGLSSGSEDTVESYD
jgi:hypothetical protein